MQPPPSAVATLLVDSAIPSLGVEQSVGSEPVASGARGEKLAEPSVAAPEPWIGAILTLSTSVAAGPLSSDALTPYARLAFVAPTVIAA